jgi:prepilin-type N-terminal cleavage/methylation domain-containing protein
MGKPVLSWGMARHRDKRGFTLVEAAIVVVVFALMLTFTIPWMREQERQRLQALADTEPWEVFEFRATPAKKLFAADEEIVIECAIENMTNQPLMLPPIISTVTIAFGTEPRFVMNSHPHGGATRVDAISGALLAPGKAALFTVRHVPIAEDSADVNGGVKVQRVAV